MNPEVVLPSVVVWGDETRKLKDFAAPQGERGVMAKIIRGQYRSVGAEKGMQNLIYIHCVDTCQNILADGFKVSGTRVIRSEQKFALPITYQGWFELLSEDGKAIKSISNVEDLAKVFPHWCLVRENFRAPISEKGVDNKIAVDRTRIIKAGEKLNLRNDLLAAVKTPRGVVNKRFLRCLDEEGNNVFLSFEQNTSISPIAGQNNISGVHTIKGLLEKFRLPITVRLVHGAVSTKMEKNWTSVFRFNGMYSDETAFVLPLKKDAGLLAISTREPLVLVTPRNETAVQECQEYVYCRDKCDGLVKAYKNGIHGLIDLPNPQDVVRGGSPKNGIKSLAAQSGSKENVASEDEEEEAILFEEIEEIYRYVRDGGDPPALRSVHRVRKSKL